ncbi:hypothetical protein [Rossellomorea sp. NPDC077527]|uniref:hypothetical protein n=1 Tax=Rossellomorea sp. NPDC077527 TaxID=3364510 RepID=UPI0037C8779D
MKLKKNWLMIFQMIGVAGCVLGIFQFKLGFFIAFLCTGLFFMLDNAKNVKSLGMVRGIIALFYSFYSLML